MSRRTTFISVREGIDPRAAVPHVHLTLSPRIQKGFTFVQQVGIRALLASLLVVIVAPGGALAQQDARPAGVGDTPSYIWLPSGPDASQPPVTLAVPASRGHKFEARFTVVNAPAQFDQVLQIVDFPQGSWTPLHTPGGYVYTTVIDGTISTRLAADGGARETTFEAGDTFVQNPGEYLQVGNASARNTRIMATAVLPARAPLTIYQDGFTSNAYPTLSNWNYTHDMNVPLPGPETVYRSVKEVQRPEGPLELVQLVLDLTAQQSAVSNPDRAQLAALYAVPAKGSTTSDEVGDGCVNAWGRLSGDTQSASTQQFERVAANLCVSSAYVPGPTPQQWFGASEGIR